MKKILSLAAMLLFVFAANAQKTITVNIDCKQFKAIKNGAKVKLYLCGERREDSTYVKKGKATFAYTDLTPQETSLSFPDVEKKPNMLLYLDYGTTDITLDGTTYESFMNTFLGQTTTGNPTHMNVEKFNDIIFRAPADVDPFEGGKIKAGLEEAIQRADLSSAFILCKYCNSACNIGMAREIKGAMDRMSDEVKQTIPYKGLEEQMNVVLKTIEGVRFPDFTMPDVNGNNVTLYEYVKGHKCVLVDFWASWCAPCRKEGKNVKAIYEDYKDKGFTVLGVSLDDNREKWLTAVKEEGYAWTQVSDLQAWKTKIVTDLEIHGIPALYILDGEGNIVAKNLRGDDMRAKVKEMCGE